MGAGAPFLEFKEMRHSFVCACLRAGHSAEEVARWLGHSTTRMVHEHYAHLLNYDETPMFRLLDLEPKMVDRVDERVDKTISDEKGKPA